MARQRTLIGLILHGKKIQLARYVHREFLIIGRKGEHYAIQAKPNPWPLAKGKMHFLGQVDQIRFLSILNLVWADKDRIPQCTMFWSDFIPFGVLCTSQKFRIPPQIDKMKPLAALWNLVIIHWHDHGLLHVLTILMSYSIYIGENPVQWESKRDFFCCQWSREPRRRRQLGYDDWF